VSDTSQTPPENQQLTVDNQAPPPENQQQTPDNQQQQTSEQPPVPRETDETRAPDWRDRRIGEQQQRLRERNARIQQLEAQLAQVAGQTQPGYQPDPAPPGYPQQPAYAQPVGDIQRQINEAAAAMAQQAEFTRRCNDVAEAGRRVYQNFDARVQRLTGLVDGSDASQVERYNNFLRACMQTGQASRLIYELGGDLDEASRIMAQDAIGMATELTRMSMRTGSEASGAPRPVNPVASLAQSNRTMIQPDDPDGADQLSTDEWMRRRDEQVVTRRQRTLG
jgi:hypothetical protein